MHILIIGAGGIGSYLLDELCKCIEYQHIDPNTRISIADDDIVEVKQVQYQNFTFREAGVNKARALSSRFKSFGITAIEERITSQKQMKGFDLIVLCVDNEPSREMVITHCFKKGIEFLDLRASGRTISAFPKQEALHISLGFVDSDDTKSYSCQNNSKGNIDKGNKIIALIGAQMILNYVRGMNNRIINMSI